MSTSGTCGGAIFGHLAEAVGYNCVRRVHALVSENLGRKRATCPWKVGRLRAGQCGCQLDQCLANQHAKFQMAYGVRRGAWPLTHGFASLTSRSQIKLAQLTAICDNYCRRLASNLLQQLRFASWGLTEEVVKSYKMLSGMWTHRELQCGGTTSNYTA